MKKTLLSVLILVVLGTGLSGCGGSHGLRLTDQSITIGYYKPPKYDLIGLKNIIVMDVTLRPPDGGHTLPIRLRNAIISDLNRGKIFKVARQGSKKFPVTGFDPKETGILRAAITLTEDHSISAIFQLNHIDSKESWLPSPSLVSTTKDIQSLKNPPKNTPYFINWRPFAKSLSKSLVVNLVPMSAKDKFQLAKGGDPISFNLMVTRQFHKAIPMLEALLDQAEDPNSSAYLVNLYHLGLSYLAVGRSPEDALSMFEAAQAKAPRDSEIQRGLRVAKHKMDYQRYLGRRGMR